MRVSAGNLLFTWRRKAAHDGRSDGGGPVELVPVRVTPEARHPSDAPGELRTAGAQDGGGRMEIVLGDGARILVGAAVASSRSRQGDRLYANPPTVLRSLPRRRQDLSHHGWC